MYVNFETVFFLFVKLYFMYLKYTQCGSPIETNERLYTIMIYIAELCYKSHGPLLVQDSFEYCF